MSDASKPVAAKGGSNPRQTILLGVLVLLGVALAYDYKVARPSVNAAYDKIAQKSMQVNSSMKFQKGEAETIRMKRKKPKRLYTKTEKSDPKQSKKKQEGKQASRVVSWRAK